MPSFTNLLQRKIFIRPIDQRKYYLHFSSVFLQISNSSSTLFIFCVCNSLDSFNVFILNARSVHYTSKNIPVQTTTEVFLLLPVVMAAIQTKKNSGTLSNMKNIFLTSSIRIIILVAYFVCRNFLSLLPESIWCKIYP